MSTIKKVSPRKSFINTGPFGFVAGVICTMILVYNIDVETFQEPKHFQPFYNKNIVDIQPLKIEIPPKDHTLVKAIQPLQIEIPPKDHILVKTSPDTSDTTKGVSISSLVNEIKMTNVTTGFTLFQMDTHIEPFKDFFTIRNTTITTLPNTYTLDARINCQTSKTDLLILIPSVVKDTTLRHDIRMTWASIAYDSKFNQNDIAKVVFFFGDSALSDAQKDTLKSESNLYGDIVTIDMIDSYKNLSLKISSMLLWSADKCPSAKFVAKVDEDTLINIPLLIKHLENLTEFTDRYNILASTVGFRHAFKHPPAPHSGRWEIPISLYPHDVLPRYVYGHSYVLSRKAVDNIVSTIPFFPVIPNEDAFITGIMSLVAKNIRVFSPAFAHLFKKQTYLDVQYNRYVSSIHSKTNLVDIWKRVKSHTATDENIFLY